MKFREKKKIGEKYVFLSIAFSLIAFYQESSMFSLHRVILKYVCIKGRYGNMYFSPQ